MIKKTPGADHSDLPVRQCAGHLGGPAEWNPASGQQQLLTAADGSGHGQVLLWPRIKITHALVGPFFSWLCSRIALNPPTSSSLADEKRVSSLLLRTAARYRSSQSGHN
jgi:hypothetical protein